MWDRNPKGLMTRVSSRPEGKGACPSALGWNTAATITSSIAATTVGTSFSQSANYRHFLSLYARYVEPIADTYAYCLLPNHFHLLVRVKEAEEQQRTLETRVPTARVLKPSQQFANLFNAYAKAINKAYGRTGSLFENPFERIRVTADAHFAHLTVYIHCNPQKEGIVTEFCDWPFSSYHAMLSTKPTRLKRDDVLAWFDGLEGLVAAHKLGTEEAHIAPLLLDDFE